MATPAKPKSQKPNLNDSARLILTAAAERKDRLVFPLPESLAASGKKVEKVINELLARRLIEECPAKLEDAIWHTDEQQRHLTLRVSDEGLKALGAPKDETDSPQAASRTAETSVARVSKPPRRQKQATKAERILALLRRRQGVTITELTKSTGWQPHSIRGFLAGTLKRKMKLKLKSERPEGKERRYRVA